jgi:hypothetical protein
LFIFEGMVLVVTLPPKSSIAKGSPEEGEPKLFVFVIPSNPPVGP